MITDIKRIAHAINGYFMDVEDEYTGERKETDWGAVITFYGGMLSMVIVAIITLVM